MTEPTRQHNHPLEGPVVTLHMRYADRPLTPGNPAHCFGPFASEAEARAFEEGKVDQCHKMVLDVYGDPGLLILTDQERSDLKDALDTAWQLRLRNMDKHFSMYAEGDLDQAKRQMASWKAIRDRL